MFYNLDHIVPKWNFSIQPDCLQWDLKEVLSDKFLGFNAQMLPISSNIFWIFRSFNIFTKNSCLLYGNCNYWFPMILFIELRHIATFHIFKMQRTFVFHFIVYDKIFGLHCSTTFWVIRGRWLSFRPRSQPPYPQTQHPRHQINFFRRAKAWW